MPHALVGLEPPYDPLLEFCGRDRDCATVIGARDFPEHHPGIREFYSAGVANRNIAVNLAVDQEYRNVGVYDCVLGRYAREVKIILPAGVGQRNFHHRTEDRPAKPGASVELLSHAVVGDFTEAGEGRFGGNSAEVRLRIERLQELRGSHGFAESEDTSRVMVLNPLEPATNVVALEQAVRWVDSAAEAVGAGVGHQNAIAMVEEYLRVALHSEAVVA